MRRLARSLGSLGFFAPLLACAVLLGGCDKSEDQPDKAQPAAKTKQADEQAKPEPKPGAVLSIGPAKIMPKGQPEKAVEITAEGKIKLSSEASEGWTVTPDGKVTKPDGTVIAQVGVDGGLSIGGKPSGIVLNDRGLVLSSPDGRTVTMMFGDDGTVLMEPPPGPGMEMTAEGCSKGVAKTCALVLSLYLLAAG